MSLARQIVGTAMQVVGAYVTIVSGGTFPVGNWLYFVGTAVKARGDYLQAKKERRRAIDDYNSKLQNRLEMLDLQPDAPRTLVLGRVRAVEGVRRRWTSGTNDEKLTMIVSLAGHEIDAVEQWYLDDKLVTLDAQGWVNEEPYRKAGTSTRSEALTLDGAGAAAFTCAETPVGGVGAVTAHWSTGSGDGLMQGSLTVVSVVGSVITLSGGPADAGASVIYSVANDGKYVRIRPYLGAAGQNVGAALAAEYAGKITSSDKFSGIALAVVDVVYNQDVFPQGRPTVTAVMRGAKCLDPRTSTTAWTENPALHALHYATWAHGWALPAGSYSTADIEAAADVCDVSTVFSLRDAKSPTTVTTATLPRHRCGIVIASSADHAQAMDDIVDTMAGRHGWAGGVWRLRAGAVADTVAEIDQTWLVSDNSDGGRPGNEPVISAVQSVPRAQRINRVTGSFVDPFERWQTLPYPAVQDAVLVAAEGERPAELTYPGVNHIAHAQHLASIAIRQAQAGLRLELTCDERAGALELFDVVELTMPRYGFTAKTFEVIGWTWSAQGAYKVALAEITDAIFEPLAELTGRDPAPDSDLRAPWDVEQITGLAVTSGTTATQDGSILTRVSLSWDAVVGESVRQGGSVEVQYALTDADLTLDWPSWVEAGTSTGTVIPGLMAGRNYVFRARAVQGIPLVRGAWSATVVHQVADVPAVAGGAGQYKAFVFKRAATAPATPTGDTPAGWFDAPPAADGNVLWASVADKESDGTLIGAWSAPVQIEGSSVVVEYSVDGSTSWHSTWVTGDLYARYSTDGGGTWDGPWKIVGEDGAAGDTARGVYLDSGLYPLVVPYDAAGNRIAEGNGYIHINANPVNTSGTVYYEWFVDGSSVQGGGGSGAGLTNDDRYTWTKEALYADMPVTVSVEIREGAWTNPVLASDAVTIVGLKAGTGGISAILSNEAHVFPASATGAVSSYTGSGTEIRVYEGSSALTYDGTGTASGTWTFSSSATNITRGSITDSGTYATIGVHSGVADATDTSSITYTVTGKTLGGVSFSIAKSQTFSKSKTGGTGNTGQSNHRVYKAVTIGSPPATPGTTTSGATPSTWSATPLTLTSGQEQYQSDGTTPAGSTTTTWGTPYPSYLKVGSLSAISADLGTVTAGTLDTSGYVRAVGTVSYSTVLPGGTSATTSAIIANTSGAGQIGVTGYSSTAGYGGIYGYNSSSGSGSAGVAGYSPNFGVYGVGSVAGVAGASTVASGKGVNGTSSHASGVGVYAGNTGGGTALQVAGPIRIDQTPSTSAAGGAVTYMTNLPSGSSAATARWVEMNFNGTAYWVPCVPK